MMNTRYISLCAVLLAAISASSQTKTTDKTAPSATQAQAKNKAVHAERDGNVVFQQNCSRCHTAPEVFPPSISGTIVRHMRVRAGLSQQDAEALLRFLNP
jgi:cytochrome c5